MLLLRPLWFVVTCLVVWAIHLGLHLAVTYALWPMNGAAHRVWGIAELLILLILGALLVLPLPRALRWRMRRSVRILPEVLQERRRIARDLHDHLGPQLVGALEMLDAGVPSQREVRRRLEQCLLDLRLTVDSIGMDEGSLIDRLARLRHRMLPALQRQGVGMDWSLDCPEGVPPPRGDTAAHLGAIAQEALSNVLQHAQATRVAVRLECGVLGWCLEVRDNGVGTAVQGDGLGAPVSGMGLQGMRTRAQQVGGLFSVVRPSEGGTCIRVLVPHAAPVSLTNAASCGAASTQGGVAG